MTKVEIGNATLYLGDCLEIVCGMPEESIDAIVTDPPFSSGARTDAGKAVRGAMLRGAKWQGDWFSHDNMATHGFLFLMRLLGSALHRVCKVGANGHYFIDWRMYPNLYGALESSGWVAKNLVVWDKKHFGMGQQYRNQHELILYVEKGTAEFYDKGIGNVISVAREQAENHPTEKPVLLIEKLLAASTAPNAVILDPFMGSGTTGVACMNLGRRFVGVDIARQHFDMACERIKNAHDQQRLFASAPKMEQASLLA